MENSKKIRILIVTITFVFLVIFVILFFDKNNNNKQVPLASNSTDLELAPDVALPTIWPSDGSLIIWEYDNIEDVTYRFKYNDASRLAAFFAEQLGSSSNQSNYSNATNLKIYMTAKMRDWVDKHIGELVGDYGSEYDSVTTKAVETKVSKYNEIDGTYLIIVTTRRTEKNSQNNNSSNPFTNYASVGLVKEKGVWLVDSFEWVGLRIPEPLYY